MYAAPSLTNAFLRSLREETAVVPHLPELPSALSWTLRQRL